MSGKKPVYMGDMLVGSEYDYQGQIWKVVKKEGEHYEWYWCSPITPGKYPLSTKKRHTSGWLWARLNLKARPLKEAFGE